MDGRGENRDLEFGVFGKDAPQQYLEGEYRMKILRNVAMLTN